MLASTVCVDGATIEKQSRLDGVLFLAKDPANLGCSWGARESIWVQSACWRTYENVVSKLGAKLERSHESHVDVQQKRTGFECDPEHQNEECQILQDLKTGCLSITCIDWAFKSGWLASSVHTS